MKKSESLANTIRGMGGTCMFFPKPRHTVLLETTGEGVAVSLDIFPEGYEDAEPIESRTENFGGLEEALERFTIDGKPLCECGGEPTAPFIPA